MSIIKIESVSNIESIMPMFEVINSNANQINKNISVINSEYEISITGLENSNAIIDSLIEDDDDFEGLIEENDVLTDLDIVEGIEGKEQLTLHLKKERNYSFMKKCKQLYALKDKYLHCEICNFSFYERYGDIGINFIEGHHKYPIAELKAETKIKSSDILMVCSNCHRMIHKTYPCLSEETLRTYILDSPYR